MKHAKNIIKINCEVISKQIKRSFLYFYSTLTFKIRHELWSLRFKVAHVLVKFRFRMENFARLNLCENFSAKNTSCWGVNKNVLSTPFYFWYKDHLSFGVLLRQTSSLLGNIRNLPDWGVCVCIRGCMFGLFV